MDNQADIQEMIEPFEAKNCSLWPDNDVIVKDGKLISEDMKARG